jgi:hypothetical protein
LAGLKPLTNRLPYGIKRFFWQTGDNFQPKTGVLDDLWIKIARNPSFNDKKRVYNPEKRVLRENS